MTGMQTAEAWLAGALPWLVVLTCALAAAALVSVWLARPRRAESAALARLAEEVSTELSRGREEAARTARDQREALHERLGDLKADQAGAAQALKADLGQHLSLLAEAQRQEAELLRRRGEELRQTLEKQIESLRTENAARLEQMRATVDEKLQGMLELRLGELKADQATATQALKTDLGQHLGALADASRQEAERMRRQGEELRQTLEKQLEALRGENAAKLEQMRATVDEKLQGTLEQRLGESFRLVSERLEAVHKGLGEMQTLASGVGDLKRVLSNVKARGGWGEVQLGALLEQTLTPEQYLLNAQVKENTQERVEYAVRLPGRSGEGEVLLPIDAKFPIEDYERLQHAAERAGTAEVEAAAKALEQAVRVAARSIAAKYVNPPRTTDFALMFLPTEGLYAEVLRRPGLADELQRLHRVVPAGPTTLAALLNSLQMGFRTLAIERRSSEVWQVLAAVKTEFGKFGPVLDRVRKKLQEATNSIDDAGKRGRAIERRLRDVETLPGTDVEKVLGLSAYPADDEREAAE